MHAREEDKDKSIYHDIGKCVTHCQPHLEKLTKDAIDVIHLVYSVSLSRASGCSVL